MKADDPNVGTVLEELTRRSIREMNAMRRQEEKDKRYLPRRMERVCPPHLCTVRQIAELLNVAHITVRVWALRGKIPSVVFKGQRFYEADKVVAEFRKMDFRRR